MDSPLAAVVALLRATHPWVCVPLLAQGRWPGLLPVIDALITYQTPSSWSDIDEYVLIDTRIRIEPFPDAHLARLRSEFESWARAPKASTPLELAYVTRILPHDAFTALPERTALALAEDLRIDTAWLITALAKARNVRALMKLARARAVDLDEQILAAEAAQALGHLEARELVTRLVQTRDRKMRSEGM